MDRDLLGIVTAWERAVSRMHWPSQTELNHWLNSSGFPPAHWRTTSLATIRRPGFCEDMIHKIKRKLHGRFRLDLRRKISAATQAREALREQGKLKKVIASILQRDTDLYALHSLQSDQGMLTDAPTIHNLVTAHFEEWYRAPGPPSDWPSLLTDRAAFQTLAAAKNIPQHLIPPLWEAFTYPLRHSALQQDLQQALSSPPSLLDFQAAIHHHKGSTAPGATGHTTWSKDGRPR